ncbi:hypothetical protein JTE90_003940 [Oedothorax gibbosus]|uniref:Uncharacterized protein n=1 Tax=Oedothorax gibbosus TaxID=931172 RepID=A0AAV6UWW0_9ARAC|nr:hypothetical protein JTE90_003940 [Oedothorax gibbosus]
MSGPLPSPGLDFSQIVMPICLVSDGEASSLLAANRVGPRNLWGAIPVVMVTLLAHSDRRTIQEQGKGLGDKGG